MKKWICGIMAALIIFGVGIPVEVAASEGEPSRIINVVYDDSGSMFRTGGALVDTWCQAKYSMEVFASMLGENDQMNVYYMSDYESSTSAAPRIQLDGSDGASANVAKIHNETTVAGNTPFNSVKKAYSDLESAQADEKWLVVLTDGEFQGVDGTSDIDAYFANKADDISVMYLGMGANADGITANESENIFYVEAATSSQILTNITDICTRIFDYNKLEINVSSKTTSFDVPMSELIVFAQGANVSIEGLEDEDGTTYLSSTTPVEVKYSECDATNYSNEPVKDLLGEIATFKDDFAAGNYTINVSGAETIEIYYKPNIEIAVYLTDGDGNEVTDLTALEAGEYEIAFGFVKTGTKEIVEESELLGEVNFQAIVTNNGTIHENTYTSGDKITLEEGDLTIDAIGTYLEYSMVSTVLEYGIYKNKTITFELLENPTYTVISEGFVSEEVITIQAQIDGEDFTQEQWDSLEIPSIQITDTNLGFKIELDTIEKSDEIGVFYAYPVFPNEKPSTGTYSDCNYEVTLEQTIGSESWSGSMEATLKLVDERSWWERNWDLFVKLVIYGFLAFLLIGYLPFVKHYLPKSLKKKPYIKCIPSEPGEKRKDRNGLVEKSLLSTIIPYVPQKGTIKYVPKGVTNCPALAVKGIKNRRMAITNIKAFAGKDYITFDGDAIKKDVKKFETGSAVSIRTKRGEWTYLCSPNQASN